MATDLAELQAKLWGVADELADHNVDLDDLEHSQGLEFVALQASAAETLLVNDDTRRKYTRLATDTRNAFKSLLPDPHAQARTRRVAVVRSLAKKLASATDPPDINNVMDSVSELLDRSVEAELAIFDLLTKPEPEQDRHNRRARRVPGRRSGLVTSDLGPTGQGTDTLRAAEQLDPRRSPR